MVKYGFLTPARGKFSVAQFRSAIRSIANINAKTSPETVAISNAKLGFQSVDANVNIRFEGTKVMIGNREFGDLANMTDAEIVDFHSVFPAKARERMTKASGYYAGEVQRSTARSKSDVMVERKRGETTIVENHITNATEQKHGLVQFMNAAVPFFKYGVLLAGLITTGVKAEEIVRKVLNSMIKENSGCFLRSSEGALIKLNDDPDNCNCERNFDYRDLCCEKCKEAGDLSTRCPGETDDNPLWIDPYVCPPTTTETDSNSKSCVSCGCRANVKWQLCSVKLDLWDVLADLAADTGHYMVELADGTIGILSAFTSKILTPVLISFGSVIGVAFAVGMGILIARFVKKKRPPQLTLGSINK